MSKKDKGGLLKALTSLIQVVTLILLIHVIQAGFGVIAGILFFLFRLGQPAGII